MTGLAGKRRNIILVWLIWPFITVGIYYFVWYYKVNREARDFRVEVSPTVAMLAQLIGWILIVPPFISSYKTGNRIAEMQRRAGLDPTCSGLIGLVLMFVAGLHALYYQHELNRIWSHYGEPPEGSEVPLKTT